MQFRHTVAAFAAAALLLGTAMPAHALFGDDDARRAILELRERLDAARDAQFQLQGQIEQLRDQNAQMTGRIEELSNELSMQQRSVRDLFGNLDKRVSAFETALVQIDDREISVSAEERRRYDLGLALFAKGDYAQSKKLLQSLVDVYPQTQYMPAALYWLGNALYASGELKEAIVVQEQLIKDFPKDVRVPDAMLSKAAAEVGLNRRTAASKTLNAVVKSYPGTPSADLAKERLKSLRKQN